MIADQQKQQKRKFKKLAWAAGVATCGTAASAVKSFFGQHPTRFLITTGTYAALHVATFTFAHKARAKATKSLQVKLAY